MSLKERIRTPFRNSLQQSGILVALIVIVIFFALLNPNFLSAGNLTNIVLQYSYILILAIGMLLVIVLGQIDLSVGSVVALTGAVAGVLAIKNGVPWWLAILAALAVGLAVGAFQGFWVAFVGIPGFIVTLAGMLLFRGMTYQVLDNVSLSPFPNEYYTIANGFLNGLLGGDGYDVFTIIIFAIAVVGYAVSQFRARLRRIEYKQHVESVGLFVAKIVVIGAVVMWFGYKLSTSRGLPFILILLGVLILIYQVVTQKTAFGRSIYAIGGNKEAARLSGINVRSVTFLTYVNMGLLCAIAGVAFSARMNGAQPGAGNMFELDAIAACFIGGASTTGGTGRIAGALIGGLIMAILSNGMQLMGADTSTQQIVKGLVLLLAVAFDVFNRRRAGLR
ncbi:MAG: sugar ABC transporter permease [Trueperella sp.]|uniref:multiple monosaccharide ABC transporter permease n=1 Tax=Trueperella TaxID=1069494 RepID=UPI0022EA9CFD|nr:MULTISPECIES: multiple monosaccharide ABC transporter permease [Trueperella]MCI7305250.1 sugar ABC transporter permease [Trueperella sp.]